MKTLLRNVLTGWFFIAVLATVHAQELDVPTPRNQLLLQDNTQHYLLPRVDYLNTSATETPESVTSLQFHEQWTISEGVAVADANYLNDRTHWFRLDVEKVQDSQSLWWLVVDWPLIDYLRLHVYDHDSQTWRSDTPMGTLFPNLERPVINRNFILPLSLQQGAKATVLLEVKVAGTLVAPMSVWRRDAYILANQINLILIGLVLGAVGAMMLYNLGIFTVLKDKSYLYYSIYGAAILFYMLSSLGIGSLYVWGESAWMNARAYPISATLSFLTAMLFCGEFLSVRHYGKWLSKFYFGLVSAWLIATLLTTFGSLFVASYLTLPLTFITTIAGFAVPIYLWRQGNEQAKFFLLAWSLVLIGTVAISLSMMGVIPFTTYVYYIHLFSFFCELMLLAYALAHRINHERRQRIAAQAETVRIQQQLNDELEVHVKKRTKELKLTLDQLEMANEELTRLSVTDSMTKVFNRRYFDRSVTEECRRAFRGQKPLAILLLDIDHFKKINDNFGHAIGDECLRVIAKTLRAQVKRSGDLLARFGGEEFVCMLPETNMGEAQAFAEQCRLSVSAIEFECNGVKVKLTASMGVAADIPATENAHKTLIDEADKALYQAKSLGRDRVICANIPTSISKTQALSIT